MVTYHIPAMLEQAVSILDCRPGKWIVDCTLGGSGHADAILSKILPNGRLIGIDRDPDAIANAQACFSHHRDAVTLIHDNFKNINSIFDTNDIRTVDGILVDLGVSLHQLRDRARGFSFLQDAPLDMRMDPEQALRAQDIIDTASEAGLSDIFHRYGEERWARRIAKQIVKERERTPIDSTLKLVRVVESVVRKSPGQKHKIHPATRVFMALRIAVNEELEGLGLFIESAVERLNPQGRLCVLSFHSLEDRIVKQSMRKLAQGCVCPPKLPRCVCHRKALVKMITKKALRPTDQEVAENPMARSTRLRAVEKL
jgi:16S rRNA (cytosine1402-N4)-methyltransferase